MALDCSSSPSSEKNTTSFVRPRGIASTSQSANSSVNLDTCVSLRAPKVVYPTVSVSVGNSPSQSPTRGFSRPAHYSVTQIQYDNLRHRCKMLDAENQRLMRTQSDIIADSNRRVEMHVSEIRMLKEEIKKVNNSNKELRNLCCFLDDDRQKARRLAKEWQKFGRYTSQVMKHEIQQYQQHISGIERRNVQLGKENEELRQLCLYLDEQRQCLLGRTIDEDSEDLGCGGSERSSTSEPDQSKMDSDTAKLNVQREETLRMISAQMQTSICSEATPSQLKDSTELIGYIQSLESRIKNLEMHHPLNESIWTSGSQLDSEEKTVIERWETEATTTAGALPSMQMSTTSTMTSSCTTYASSETDLESAVYVMGDEIDVGNLEVRTLSKIDEETDTSERIDSECPLPPPCAPLSASLLSVGNLSTTKDSEMEINQIAVEAPLFRSASESTNSCHRGSLRASSVNCHSEFDLMTAQSAQKSASDFKLHYSVLPLGRIAERNDISAV